MKSSVIVLSLIVLLVGTVSVAVLCQNMDDMNGGISMTLHHFSDYHTFTNATGSSFIFFSIFLALSLLVFFTLFQVLVSVNEQFSFPLQRWRQKPETRAISLQKFITFLSLFEQSPSLA